ncbi:MAG: hypothetical protein ACOVOW_05210 [Spirosomataceae bacterium]|jgi:hypothetical protein
MKKLFTLFSLSIALLAVSSSKLSAQTFKKGDKQFNVGLGLLAFGGYASAEFGIEENIGIGPIVGYTYYNSGLLAGYSGDYGYGQFRAGARGAYHLGDVLNLNDDKIDPYVAVSAGLVFDREGYLYNSSTGGVDYKTRTLPFINPRVGASMELSDQIRGYAELGWGGSWLQAGVSFKF